MSAQGDYSVLPEIIGNTLQINATGLENGRKNIYQGNQTLYSLKKLSPFFDNHSTITEAASDIHNLMKQGQAGVAQQGYSRYLQVFPPTGQNPFLIPLHLYKGTPTLMATNPVQTQRTSGTYYNALPSPSQTQMQKTQILRSAPPRTNYQVNPGTYYNAAPSPSQTQIQKTQYLRSSPRTNYQVAPAQTRTSYTSSNTPASSSVVYRSIGPKSPGNDQILRTIVQQENAKNQVCTCDRSRKNEPFYADAKDVVNHLVSEIDTLKQENESLRKSLRNSVPRVENADAEETLRHSLVLKTPEDLQLIEEKLGGGEDSLEYSLAYRATADGDKAETFHKKCDDIANSLVFIKTKDGKRFGGYTKQSWCGDNEYKKDDEAFVFSLDKNKVYPVTQEQNAIWTFENCGPIFEGYQIDVPDNFLNGQPSKTGFAGVGYETTEDFELNDGQEKFVIDEMEVYEVKQK